MSTLNRRSFLIFLIAIPAAAAQFPIDKIKLWNEFSLNTKHFMTQALVVQSELLKSSKDFTTSLGLKKETLIGKNMLKYVVKSYKLFSESV